MTTLCGCGCGSAAPIAAKTDRRTGHVKGLPIQFINTHNSRLRIVHRPCSTCGREMARGAVRRCRACEDGVRNREGLTRFWSRVDATGGPGTCWPWTGFVAENGYGKTSRGRGRHVYTHRVAYEAVVAPVKDGLELDHVCHSLDLTCAGGPTCPHRRCCNPDHLEPVPHLVNVRRGRSVAKAAA